MQRYFDVVQNRQGTAVVGATVTVYDANGNLATLYSNNSGAASSNPVYTNSDGEYAFYAANGTYSITIALAGYATETKPGVVLFDPSDSGASNNVQFLQAGTGAQVRSVQSKLRDVVSVKDFGAVGDGVTDDTAAITNYNAASGFKVTPFGIYNASSTASTTLDGPFYGIGQIKDSAANKRAPNFSAIKSAPSSFGNSSSAETAFNGDLSKCLFPTEYRITGASTLTQPATGYVYVPEATPYYTYFYNASGWNQSTSGNSGRTGATAFRTIVYQAGQGDCVAYNASGFVTGQRAGATSFLANPAASLFNGDMNAGQNGVYLNPRELALNDNGFDVACVGDVINLNRTVAIGGLNVFWAAYRSQSIGSQPVDVAFSAVGDYRFGIDFSFCNFGANQAAISLAANQRIYGNVAPTDSSGLSRYPSSVNTDYITYSSSLSGWNFVVNNTSIFQLVSSQVSATQLLLADAGIRINGATPAGVAGLLGIGTTTNTSATAGTNGDVPAQVAGYLTWNLGTSVIKIPYYNA